jgi:hypothetical protein
MYGIINFQTNLGSVLMIRTVQVKPKDHAIIKCIFSEQDGDNEKHKILMEGDDYKLWGENDDYLGHYCIKKITGGTETIVGSDYVAPTKPNIISDNRSVHNEADITKITTLEEQMVEEK